MAAQPVAATTEYLANVTLPSTSSTPLAERLRPQTLADVIGQQQLLGPGMPLRLAFESGQPHS